ncbi:MAG: valine--tRNA ligase [Acidilobaceae archaeon]|nr:valine--tRNA ligase [Acidilobaceae archaeon]
MGSLELRPKISSTRWDHARREAELRRLWEEEGLYGTRLEGEKLVIIDTPPPYASGRWHVGGASHFAQIDMVGRYFRLKGYAVVMPFYADRNGLPVEVQVEKVNKVNAKEMARTVEGRREFLKLCKEFLDKAEAEIVEIWKSLGCSFDYWPEGTDSPLYRAITQETFVEMYKRGLIYEAERPVRWCPRCGTTLAEAEVEHEEEEGALYYVKYRLAEDGRSLVVATTRPELLAGCAALAYHPQDQRYKGLVGRKAIAPLYGHEAVIVEHPAVDPHFGTGLMMICSYGDEEDVRLFNELRLKPNVVIGEDGVMNERAGPLAGLPVKEARARAAELLRERGELEKVEKIVHKVPKCWRCKTPLQIVHRRELFLSQLAFKEDMKRIADQMEFVPEMHKKKLLDWVDSITMDWPISRDRYYATEIPMWRCSRCGAVLLPERPGYYRPWEENPWERCPSCGASPEHIVGEKRVLDTWFDSSITPLYIVRRIGLKEYPSSSMLRPQGQDIIRTWLYYTMLRIYQLTGKPAFRWARVTGMGLDPTGRPMHKSLGNIIDPEPIVKEYGADAFRFWAAVASKVGYDYRFDEGKIKTGRLLVTKLWNVARLISSFPEEGEVRELTDKAFLALYEEYLERVDRAYGQLDVYEPANLLYELAWDVFASHYVELAKDRAYNREGAYSREEQASAWAAMHKMLKGILIAFSPIMPFITDDIFRQIYGQSVHRQRFPEVSGGSEREHLAAIARKIVEVNSAVWALKKRLGLRLSEPLEGELLLPRELEGAARDIAALHKVKVAIYEAPEGEEIAPGVYYRRAK